jgi:trehalose 6-phosphate synthase/phosphatase
LPQPDAPTIGGQPLTIVSNRLPYTVERVRQGLERHPSAGGLVSALDPVLQLRGGTWVGWPGVELRPGETIEQPGDPYSVVPVELTAAEVRSFYSGFSNASLWPLFHSLSSRTRFARSEWDAYQEANERFARAAAEHAGRGELVWVHDYQLMLVPALLRRLRPDLRPAFFLHIPFPPYDVFRLLPWDREVLLGLLACDLVGFHVAGYAQNFLDAVERRLGLRVDRSAGLVEHGARTVRVDSFPLGIDFERYESAAVAAGTTALAAGRERLVLGVDRLDYTKGIPERIRAFEHLLELHPEHRGRVVLLQLAVPSRDEVLEYRRLKREIDELVGRVNGRFATADWSPIRYLYRQLPFDELVALYRTADVALVTPLRDGMNLVAKEYVACQVGDPGVLVLSRLAGSAETMREALLVNPYNLDQTANALHRALTMDEAERRARMIALRRRERRDDVFAWVAAFLASAQASAEALRPPSDADLSSFISPFLASGPPHLALILDYDGTLVPRSEPGPTPGLGPSMRTAVAACAARPDTSVTVVGRRTVVELQRLVGEPEVTVIGNHGLEIQGPDLEPFRHEDLELYRGKREALLAALERLPANDVEVEADGALVNVWLSPPGAEREHLAERIRTIIREEGFQPVDTGGGIVARPPIGWDKGRAVLHLLRTRYGPEWPERVRVIYVGDDQTDEDAFDLLSGLAMTFRVRSEETESEAGFRLPTVDSVEALLRWLAGRPPPRR